MPEFKRPITIKDIAREAGVSTAAVSYALRGNPKVGKETRERIEKIAKELGYQRNPAFAAIGAMAHRHASSREGLPLGYLRQLDENGNDYHGAEIIRGVKKRCAQLGYRLESFLLDDFKTPQDFLKLVANRGLSGLILGHLVDTDLLRTPQLNRCAMIATSLYRQSLPVHTVRVSRYQGALQALLNTYAHGYRKILVFQLWHNSPMEDDYARYAGTLAAIRQIKEKRETGNDTWIHMVPRPVRSQHEIWKEMIEKYQPDAVIGFNGSDYYPMRDAGYTNPDQLGFAVEEMNPNHCVGFNVAGIANCNDEIGGAAVEWIDQLIRLGQFGIPDIAQTKGFEPRWVNGDTLPKRT